MADTSRMLLLTATSVVVTVMVIGQPVVSNADEIGSTRKSELIRLVRQDCGSCHGMTLKGGLGTSLLPKDLIEITAEEISEIILEGVTGTPMPAWKGLLTEAEANWISDQLKSGSIRKGNAQ